MPAKILPLHNPRASAQPIADYLRVGDNGHRRLAVLHAEGRLPAKRVVFGASMLHHQKELLKIFKESGAEIVLDTKAAELGAPARFGGYARYAPWATSGEGRPLQPHLFSKHSPADVIGQIARFAVEHGVHVVLSPAHFLAKANQDIWFPTDLDACVALREALDREGGKHIRIDYPLILPHTQLNDAQVRGHLVGPLGDLPFDHLWVRASGFGRDATAVPNRRYLEALMRLHNIGKPLIADHLGGLVGLSALAFGAVSGLSHGLGEMERFDARGWHKPPPPKEENQPGGRTVRIHIAGFDKSLKRDEIAQIAAVRGGRRLIACDDRSCCRNGLQDMLDNPQRHVAYQRYAQLRELQGVPDLRREQHFLDGALTAADRRARQIKELRVDEKLARTLGNQSDRLDKMRAVLENFHETRDPIVHRSLPARHRGESVETSRQGRV